MIYLCLANRKVRAIHAKHNETKANWGLPQHFYLFPLQSSDKRIRKEREKVPPVNNNRKRENYCKILCQSHQNKKLTWHANFVFWCQVNFTLTLSTSPFISGNLKQLTTQTVSINFLCSKKQTLQPGRGEGGKFIWLCKSIEDAIDPVTTCHVERATVGLNWLVNVNAIEPLDTHWPGSINWTIEKFN